MEKGLGYREGGIECYNGWINSYLGQTLDEGEHIITDWNNPLESPEAVCWLREDYLHRDPITLKNFEHFLTQRDKKDFYTDPVEKTKKYHFYMDPPDIDYDFAARKTNVKNNDKGMLFYIDEGFRKAISKNFYIKVMYLDKNKCDWYLEYGTPYLLASSDLIKGTADGKWKTATFDIHQFLGEQEPFDSDFALKVVNNEDLIVKFVRVIKYDY